MSNQELLESISIMLDEKLEQKLDQKLDEKLDQKLSAALEPIKQDIVEMKYDIRNLKSDVTEMKSDIVEMKSDIAELQEGFAEMKSDIVEMKSDIAELQEDFAEMKGDVTELKSDNLNLFGRVKKIEIIQENKILPLLNEVVSCYVDTYKRYQEDADKMERTFEDVALLKDVVAEHSSILQRLALAE